MPQPERSVVAVAPPAPGEGTWAGAPSAACGDGEIYLAYRLRRPEGQGRGYAVVVARSADGVHFETLLTIRREELGAESLERPGLAAVPELRHAGHQALARGGAPGRSSGRLRRPAQPGRAAR